MRVDGQCHCGAIAYEAEVEPNSISICHCTDCQRLAGSAFRANVAAPAETFQLLKGEPKQYVKTADSGGKRVHAFCGECGGPVYSCAIENPRFYSLRVGALNQRDQLGVPAQQIWAKRRLTWTFDLRRIKTIEGQP